MKNYSSTQISENPLACLQSIAIALQGESTVRQQLVTQQEFEQEATRLTFSKNEDPTKHYKVLEKIVEGGQGTLYQVERIKDKKQFAMKLIQPENEQAK